MDFTKFRKSLSRAFRHLQIAGQGAKPQTKLTEAGILLTDASEEIESALEDIERDNLNGNAKADLYEATALIHEAIRLITGVHQRLA
jgi:hypothetical protein